MTSFASPRDSSSWRSAEAMNNSRTGGATRPIRYAHGSGQGSTRPSSPQADTTPKQRTDRPDFYQCDRRLVNSWPRSARKAFSPSTTSPQTNFVAFGFTHFPLIHTNVPIPLPAGPVWVTQSLRCRRRLKTFSLTKPCWLDQLPSIIQPNFRR